MKRLLIIIALFAGQACALRAVEKENLKFAILESNISKVQAVLAFREEFALADLQVYKKLAQEVVAEREKLVLSLHEWSVIGLQGSVGGFCLFQSIRSDSMLFMVAALIFGDYAYSHLRAPMIRRTNAKTIFYALDRAVEKRQKSEAKL